MMRANLTDGGSEEFSIDFQNFWYHPQMEAEPTDVAVCPISREFTDDNGQRRTLDYRPIHLGPADDPTNMVPTKDWFKKFVGLGTEVAAVGLFRSHSGKNRNIPVIRVGNIAAMPEEPINSRMGFLEAYLIEARSIAGLSGSPVIAVPDAAMLAFSQLEEPGTPRTGCLLGLMHGHFDVQNLNEDIVSEAEGDATRGIHTGMGVVIPLQKILETIEQEGLAQMRDRIVDARLKNGATPDIDMSEAPEEPKAEGADQPSNANPSHQEDFMRLVDVAARKKPQA
jgi:hypothetical protein